jgi:uncharacterized protein YjiK
MELTKTIKYLLGFFIFFLITTLLALCCIKLDVSCPCIFTSDNNTYVLAVNHKVHKYLNEQHVKKCEIRVTDENYLSYLTYKDHDNNSYIYWVSINTTIALTNQTVAVNVNFGTLSPIMYVYYLGI